MSRKEQFEQTEKLYHFTKFDTALKIIESNRLIFGRLDNMNDFILIKKYKLKRKVNGQKKIVAATIL